MIVDGLSRRSQETVPKRFGAPPLKLRPELIPTHVDAYEFDAKEVRAKVIALPFTSTMYSIAG